MCALVVALAASLLVVPPVPVLSGAGLGVSEAGAQSAGTAGVTSHSRAFLHRTVIEEGQTRQFEISNLPARPAYYVFFKPLAGYTAEASDVTFKVHHRRDGLVEVAPGEGRRASVNSLRERLRFEVAAHSDGDSDDETFGVQLCTTVDCEGGTVLGDWTVTITDVSDTTLTGTGAEITVSGGSTSMMEQLTNNDNRDVSDTITVTIPHANRPSQSIVVVGLVDTMTSSKLGADTPIANIAGAFAEHERVGPATPRVAFIIDLADLDTDDNGTVESDEWVSEFEVRVAAFDNAVDTPGGELSGNLVFTVYQYDSDYYDTTNVTVDLGNGPQTVKGPDTSTAPTPYTGIVLPDVPLTVTGDDEVTEIELHHAATTDNVAAEGGTDTAKFRVTLGRALAAGETLSVPLAFQGATLGTHFTLSLDGTPQGVAYADSADGTTGELVFTGPSAAEATVVVTAATDDGDTASNNLVVRTYPTSEPWNGNHITTNLAGGVCSGDGCGPGRLAERMHRVTLTESAPGVSVIDNGGGRLLEGDIVEKVPVVDSTDGPHVYYTIQERVVTKGGDYSYEVRLSAAPTSNVTVAVSSSDTTKATITTGSSLTFTPSNWAMPQTVTVSAADNQADSADVALAITHAVTGAGNYASIADVAHALVLVDDDPTEVSMAGTGVRTSPSGTQISEVMVEGDATRVDRSLTISLSRALTAGEWVRVPLYLEATGHRNNLDVECDLTLQDWSDISLERWADYVACDVVSSVRGPRYSANVAWPVQHNDFEMAAVGTGVSVEAVNRFTPAHVGFRWLEFAGAGAQTATIVLKARDGFDDGDVHDEEFHISFPRGLQSVRNYTDDGKVFSPQRHLNPQTNLGGGITAAQADAQAWYGIADDEEGGSSAPEVPAGWPLLPSGLNPGDSFRLIYVTSQTTTAQSSDLADYDAFVRSEITGNVLVNGGVSALAGHAGHFKAIAETSVEGSSPFGVRELSRTTARDHAQFNPNDGDHPDVPIYWVGGTKVADDNADFADGDWDDEANPRRADGTAATVHASGYWTGSGRDGVGIEVCSETSNGIMSTRFPRLGWTDATVGLLNNSGTDGFPLGPRTSIGSGCGRQHGYSHDPAGQRPMYALSGEFTVVAAGATIESATAAEGSAATFAVTIPDAAPVGGITVPYSLSDGRGIAGELAYAVATGASGGTAADYDSDAGSVVIAQGQTSSTFTVSTTDDSTYEGDHYFTVTLGIPTGTNAPGVHPAKGTATGTITDAADLPTVAFSSAAVSAAEGKDTVDVTVAKTGTTLVSSSVFWTTADGTGGSGAAHPGDYTAQSGYLEFAPNEASKTLTIGLVDDDTAESAETFKVQLDGDLAVDARVGSTSETTITLTDDDVGGAAGVTLSGSALTLTELHATDAEMSYTVVLDSDPGADVVVTVSSGDATAVAVDTDMAGDQSMLTFTHGNTGNWNSAQTVTLRAVNDGDDAAETVTVSHAAEVSDAGNPYHQIPINSVTATTVDAGHKMVVVPAAVSVNEGDTAEYGIRLASNPGGAVTLNVTAVNSSGSLTVSPATVSFNAGNWMSAQTVTISGGSGGAGGVTHSVSSSAGTARSRYPVNMVGPQVDVTVVSSAALVFDVGEGVAVSEESGHTDTYEVKLNKAPSADVTVAITAAAGAAVNPASLTFTTTNWDTGQEVTVSGVDDNTINTGGARMVTISHSTSSSDNDFNALSGNVTVRVADTDTTPTLGVTPAQVQSSAFASGGTVTLTLTPEHVTFFGVGDGDGLGPESGDQGGENLRNGGTLTASGRALLTFTGAPTGLTVDSAELGAAMSDVHGQPKHRSLEVVLSYSGSPITADDPVTLNVGRRLLRRSLSATKAVPYGASLSADFTIKAPGPVTVSMAGSDGDASGNAVEGASNATGYRTITLTLGRALTGSEEVTVPLSVVGATVTDDYTFGLEPATQTGVSLTTTGGTHTAQNPALVFAAGASSATLRLKPVDNSVRSQPYVEVGYGTGARAPAGSGVTLGTASGGPVGVVLVDDETGDFEVAADWPLLPSGLSGGDEFRLMFITSQTRTAESTDIDVYNEWARGVVAAGGHASLKPYGDLVRVVGSTTVDARVNTGMYSGSAWVDGSENASDSGVAVYWLAAPPSDKVADNYFDFYDGDWDGGSDQSGAVTVESGAGRTATTFFWTGTNNDGTGGGAQGRLGRSRPYGALVASGNPLSDVSSAMSPAQRPMLVMSPVFKVEASTGTPVTVTMSASDGDSDGNAVEGAAGATGYRTVTIALDRALTGSEEVTVPLTVVGATVTTDYTFGLQPSTQTGVTLSTSGSNSAQNPAVVFASRAQTATLRLTPVNNSARAQPYVIVDYGTGSRVPSASGAVLGAVSGGPVGVVLVDDETGDFEVAADWPLLPSGLSGGDEFRLMFITSQTRTAESTDIDVYNEWAQGVVAAGGHGGLKPYAGLVRVVGSTTTVDARVNAGMHTGSAWADGSANASSGGVAVYWLAEPSSDKVADNYFDFFDGSWDGGADQSGADTVESGAARTATAGFWTGSINDGRKDSIATRRLGATTPATARVSIGNPLSDMSAMSDASLPMLAMSPVFKVEAAATPELTFASAAYSEAEDGGSVDVTVNASSAPSAALTVNLDSQAETATEASDYTAPPTTFTFPAAMTSHTFSVNITDDNTAEGDETFTMTLASGTGYTVGMPATTTVTITDDDTPPVAVTMSASDGNSDGNAVEGGAGTTGYRTITIALGRALAGSEQVTVPLTVVGATVATDYTFALQPSTQTGVSLNTSGSNSAQNPAVVFASGAQTATLRLTPVDNNVRTQPYVIVDYGTGARVPSGSGGVTLDTPTGGPIGVVLVDDETGDIVLPAGAGFRPGVSNNAEYRLLFMTSAGGAATSTDIADYDHFVRAAAVANGGADLLPYAGFFRAFVSTASTHGREHVGIWGSGAFTDGTTQGSDSGTELYWLGTGGEQVSSSYWLFCNRPWTGRWSATATRLRHEDGSVGNGAKVWTGMNNNCTTSSNQLGTSTPTYGPGAQAGSGGSPTQSDALSLGTEAAASENRFYAVSDVFKTVASADMPQVVFTVRTGSANEGETVRLTLRASPAPTADLTLTYIVEENSDGATAGQDFTAGEASVTIPAGQTSVAFDVATLEDGVFEKSESFRVRLAASPDYLRGSARVSTVTILEVERLRVGFAQAEYWALEDGGSVDVELALSHGTERAVSLTLSVGGTATGGSDYTAPAASVTIPPGNTSRTHTITIPIAADTTVEPDETITLAIASVTTTNAGTANRSRTTVFIADQDRTAPGLVVPSTVEVDEGRTATYRLRLATAPSGTVTVSVQTAPELTLDADDSAGGDQASVQFTPSNWYVGRKVTIRGVHDPDLTDETVTLSHSASGADYGSVTGSVAATVDDEDVTLSITPGAAVTEGTAAEFTVTASSAPDRDLTVNVGIADASGADFVAAGDEGNRTRILRSGQSSAMFTVPTVADHNVESSGPITITLQNSDNYRIDSSAASAMVQVNDDDDAAVAVAMSASRDNAVEGAGDVTGYSDITLRLDGALTGAETLTVPLTVTGAAVTADYTFELAPATQTGVALDTSGPRSAQDPAVVFTAGATTATLRLTPVDNDVRTQPYVIVDFGPGAAASGGINVGEQTGGPINVVLVDDETGDIEVAADWALAPSGLSAGDEFRLIFITSQTRTAASTDIDDYNDWAQLVVAEHGHAALLPYSGLVSVIASTATVDARENTAMWDPALNSNAGGYTDSSTSDSDSGTKIYWLAAPSTDKVADNYFDFYDASWDTGTNNSSHSTNEAATKLETVYWTGSSDAGVAVSGNALGEANPQYGHVETFGNTPLDHTANADNATRFRLLTMSPVFKIDPSATGPEVSVRLMTGEGENRNDDGEVEKPENDATVSFPLTLDAQPAAALMVCVRVAESGDTDRVAAADEGIKTVSFNAGVQAGSIDVAWTDNDDDDLDSVITVTAVPSSTAGCSSTDSYTVSGANGSDKVRIADDEATEVTLTASDTAMSEQDASDTATLTVSLGRPLVADESLVAMITLASGTGARLPGHATPDFAVTASGTGVALANATSTTARVTFTGSDSNTVQTATVTLTPIATAAGDDGDTSDEEITATLNVVTATGSGTVVTGGGAEVVSASSEVDLTIDDDDASACSAQSSVFSGTSLRILETGETTYCVRLTTAPSGGSTTVTIGTTGRFTGAATASPSSLTFTASNYTEPQEVTVTGVDESGTNRDRSLRLTHTASGGGYSSQALGDVSVEVSDAPEVEVFAHVRYDDEDAWRRFVNANGGMLRPSTVTAAPGVTPMRNVTPCCEVQYAVRLSNRPLGGAVTVDISVGDFGGTTASAITGISLTRGGTPEQSLRITFEDRAPDPGCGWLVQTPNTHYDSNYREKPGVSDSYDNNADTSWECYRFIWVHNKREHQSPTRSLCADITHTATGGGVRKVTVDTIRMHSLGFNTGRVHDNPACPFLYANTLGTPQNSPLPAQAPPVPTTAVAGLSVTGGGGTTATASWDAVPHATKYSVSYSAQAQDGSLSQTAGAFDDITATSHTFDHGITAPATVTVTVTPGYDNDDSGGGGASAVTYLDSLAATVTLNTGTTPDAGETAQEEEGTGGDGPVAPPPGCVSDDTLELARDYYDVNKHRAPGYGKTWRRVLIAFGDVADAQLEPFTAAEASQSETRWAGWGPFREALECIEKAQQDQAPPPVEPEIAVTAGAGVTEGGDAVFTITAAPAPHTALSVDVTLTQTGDFVSTGTQSVTIGTSGAYTLTVATADDSADEADGSVTATIGTGTGYTVSTSSGAATVAVADNDIPEITITAGTDVTEGGDAVFTIAADPVPHTALDVAVEITQTGDLGAAAGTRTVTIPATGTYTLTVATTDDSDDEADGSITATVSTGAGYTVSSANSAATVAVADDDDPPPPPPVECVSDETLRLARDYYELNRHRAPGYGSNWRRVLVAFGDVADDQLTAFTAAEALAREQIWYGWKPFREALECIEAAQ